MVQVLFVYLTSLIAGFAAGVFRRVSNQKKTKGVIIDLKQKYRNQSGRSTYTGIVNYTVNGKEYQIETAFQASYNKGDKIIVCYNEDDPSESFAKAALIVYLFVYFLIVLGTVLLIREVSMFFNRG